MGHIANENVNEKNIYSCKHKLNGRAALLKWIHTSHTMQNKNNICKSQCTVFVKTITIQRPCLRLDSIFSQMNYLNGESVQFKLNKEKQILLFDH